MTMSNRRPRALGMGYRTSRIRKKGTRDINNTVCYPEQEGVWQPRRHEQQRDRFTTNRFRWSGWRSA